MRWRSADVGSAPNRQRWLLRAGVAASRCLHTFVFAANPVLVVVGTNAGTIPLDGTLVAYAVAVSAVATAVLLLILTPLMPDLSRRAAWLSLLFLAFGFYHVAVSVYVLVVGEEMPAGYAALYVVGSVILATAIGRPTARLPWKVTGLNLVAGTLLATNLYASVPALTSQALWRPAADALVARVTTAATRLPDGPRPNIYHVVLDGFGRADVLKDLYDLDLGPLVTALESRGFTVPSASRSNYTQTYLSLASTLNLSYLDPIAIEMPDSEDRRVLHYLIQHNALTTLARRAGYRIVGIGSNYSATERLSFADVCFCEQYAPNEIETAAINLTPLRAVSFDRWMYGGHRRKIEQQFRHLEHVAGQAGPELVFAHVIAPHPPFVFEADGRPRSNAGQPFGLSDASHFTGTRAEYVAGYRAQAQFVASRILTTVDAILSRPGPSPVIMIHGDHGPGSRWNWENVAVGDARERLGIFSAYRFPGDDPPVLPDDVTPVNALRILANRVLGTSLPPLPDRSFASTWRRPFQWVAFGSDDVEAPHPRP